MGESIYSYSLCIALPLMVFFGFYFLFAKTPEKKIFENYLRSRRIMGIALLLLAANYSVHFFFGIRFKNVNSAILMNLSTYFLCYYLFSSAMITLLDRFYITRKRSRTHTILGSSFHSFPESPYFCCQVVPCRKSHCWLWRHGWWFTGLSWPAGLLSRTGEPSGFSMIRMQMI